MLLNIQTLIYSKYDYTVVNHVESNWGIFRLKRFRLSIRRCIKGSWKRKKRVTFTTTLETCEFSLVIEPATGNDIFFVEVVQKAGHPIAKRAAKENYVETGAVTLGALYCSARLRLPRERVGKFGPSPAHVRSSISAHTWTGTHGRGRGEKRRREWDVPSGGASDRQMNCLIELARVVGLPRPAIIIPSMLANCSLFSPFSRCTIL